MRKLIFSTLLAFSSSLFANEFYYEFDKKIELIKPIESKTYSTNSQEQNSSEKIHTYQTTNGKTVKFKNELIVQCHKEAYCQDDFSDLNITNYKEISKRFFLIKVEDSQDIFTLAQKLHNKKDIKSATPNKLLKIQKR